MRSLDCALLPNMLSALGNTGCRNVKQLLAGSLWGALVGSAILLDDFITEKSPPPARVMFRKRPGDIKALGGKWSQRLGHGQSKVEADIRKDVRTELSSEEADTTDETQQLIILDGVDADDQPT